MEKWKIVEVEGKSRGMVSCCDVPAGTALLCRLPLVYAPQQIRYTTTAPLRCFECLRVLTDTNKLRCSACGICYYCSRDCQRTAWKLHKMECTLLKATRDKPLTPTMLLVLRILLQDLDISELTQPDHDAIAAQKQTSSVYVSNNWYETIYEMSEWILATVKSFGIDTYRNEPLLRFSIQAIFLKVMCNAFTICNEEMTGIGIAIYYDGPNFVNHSCLPNCCVSYDNKYLQLRAQKDIKKGEELCICYTEVASLARDRIHYLEEMYFFSCSCPLCDTSKPLRELYDCMINGILCPNCCKNCTVVEVSLDLLHCVNDAPITTAVQMKTALQDLQKHCDLAILYQAESQKSHTCLRCNTTTSAQYVEQLLWRIKEIEQLLDALASFESNRQKTLPSKSASLQKVQRLLNSIKQKVHPANVAVHRCRERHLRYLLDNGCYKEALECCEASIPTYRAIYTAKSPLYGLQLALLAKIAHSIGGEYDEMAVETFRKALMVLKDTHGDSHPYVQTISRLHIDATDALSTSRKMQQTLE